MLEYEYLIFGKYLLSVIISVIVHQMNLLIDLTINQSDSLLSSLRNGTVVLL